MKNSLFLQFFIFPFIFEEKEKRIRRDDRLCIILTKTKHYF